MRIRRVLVVGMACIATVVAFTSRADGAVIYELQGSINPFFIGQLSLNPPFEESFAFTAPDFVTGHVSLTRANLDTCVGCLSNGVTVEFWPAEVLVPQRDQISFYDDAGIVFGFFFAPGSFRTLGTHIAADIPVGLAIGNVGTLTVRRVPEPATAALLGVALLVIPHARRGLRKR